MVIHDPHPENIMTRDNEIITAVERSILFFDGVIGVPFSAGLALI